ncbi:MAG TPA: dsRBD fold-containing protein [Dermatophilaceae bacterium]
MKAQKGDRIILAAKRTDQATRDGEVLEVRGTDGGPPYLVRWTDGHTGLLYPGPGAILRVEAEHATIMPARIFATSAEPVTAGAVEPAVPHVKEWHVRVSIFESGDDTSASVVLLTEAPTHLSAHGQSHRDIGDASMRMPEIGDEVAVARALRHLADQLLETAAKDIGAVTGKEAHLLPS